MRNKKGYTLLELLIAATVVGILVVFATISYRTTSADTRMAAARMKTDVLADAVQRFRLENPTTALFDGQIQTLGVGTSVSYNLCDPLSANPEQLIYCRYIDTGGWTDAYVNYYVCKGKSGDCASSPLNEPLACMTGTSMSKQPNRYRGANGYIYCVSATAQQEVLGSD